MLSYKKGSGFIMAQQTIISIGREFGSGGHQIGEELAKRFGFSFYDRNILEDIANEKNVCPSKLQKFDEVPKRPFFSKTVRGVSNSPEDVVAQMQFDYITGKAEQGESFVVVGRCAEYILADHPGLISIFVLADPEFKLKRVMDDFHLSEEEARGKMYRHDKKRKAYNNYYSPLKWGDSRSYHLTVNSAKLGIDRTVDMLEWYVKDRMGVIE